MLVRRALLVLTVLFPALSATAQQPPPPVTRTINGSPLTIVIGDDTSMQIYNSNDQGQSQFYPIDCTPGQTGDFGLFALEIGFPQVSGPDFQNHPCGTRAQNVSTSPNYSPWAFPTISPVTGNGTPSAPFTVTVSATGFNLGISETLTYVDGSTDVGISVSTVSLGVPTGNPQVRIVLAGDINSPDNDFGFSFGSSASAGAQGAANPICNRLSYTIQFSGTPLATAWEANRYDLMWSDLANGALTNAVMGPNCYQGPGAALQWDTFFGQTVTTVASFVGATCAAITLSPPTLSAAEVGSFYSVALSATGGTGPYTFSATGNLPPGLSLSATGLISGIPTFKGAYAFSVTATDAAGCASPPTHYVILVSCPAISVTPDTLPAGAIGVNYGPIQIDAPGATPLNNFFVSSGQLPPGLSLIPLPNSSASAQIVGTPTTAGSYPFSISVRDSSGCTGTTSYSVAISSNCDAPTAPQNATLAPHGNPSGPVTYVDYLDGTWSPPSVGSAPITYVWHINGRPDETGPATNIAPQALAVPNSTDPIQLFVTAVACGVESETASSPPYSPEPPTASFNASVSGQTVTVTDVSAPEATSWLWLWGDGDYSTEQSPGEHAYATPNVYAIVLIATNGAGSEAASQTVVLTAAADTAPRGLFARDFETANPRRQRLPNVHLGSRAQAWLHLWTREAAREKVVYLRFLDADGNAVAERRLAVGEDQIETVYNVEAFGLNGDYTIELITDEGLAAALVETEPLHRVEPPSGTRRIDR